MKIRYILGLSTLLIAMQSSFAVSAVEHGLIQPVGEIPVGGLHAPTAPTVKVQTVPTTTVTPVPKVQVVPVVPVPAVKTPVMQEPKAITPSMPMDKKY